MKSQLAAAAFIPTTDENFAAAVSVLGVEVRPDKSVDVKTGMAWEKMLLGIESVPETEPVPADGVAMPKHNTRTLVGMLKNGLLQKADPHHPALDVMRACRAADELVKWTKDGKDRTLVKVQGADRYQFVERPLPPSIKAGLGYIGTNSLKMAACLCVLGCQPLRLEGQAPKTRFVFGPSGYGNPPPVPTDLVSAYRNGSMAEAFPEHPLLWMMQGLSNRDAIRDMMRKRAPILLIRAPGTGRASLISQNAKGHAWDRANKHLGIA